MLQKMSQSNMMLRKKKKEVNVKGYGTAVAASVCKYVNSAIRTARHKEHLTFNHSCRRYGVVPPFLRVKPLVRNTLE